MRSRPGVWLRSLINGLMTRPPVGYRRESVAEDKYRDIPLWANRVQDRFLTPRLTRTA
ncbi:hypothetical protein [uncultured Jatrophihabitans sp.]|uniref:hypothetical protein n=1 Tax=uncultured Jatrophihabitans sp. TaxID=1610747 RepID=UPI0035CA7224